MESESEMLTAGSMRIGKRRIGYGLPCYVVAEMSANHCQDLDRAVAIVRAAKEAGADAIKLQTYTPDTLTIDCDKDCFRIGKGTIWEGRRLYELYSEACTPWEWYPRLKAVAEEIGIELFSTPFDTTAVEFLEQMDVPVHKIASFEMVDIPLIRTVASTGKAVIMSTGMATENEIAEAVNAFRESGGKELALLKCTSAYPASAAEMNLRTIPDLAERFDVVPGLSDHTMGLAVPIASVALGACIIEKHFTLSRADPGPDSSFSLEPDEFKQLVSCVREAEAALGVVNYTRTEAEEASMVFRRSLFVVQDIKEGEMLTADNVRVIRPGHGLAPKHYDEVIGKTATRDIERGRPLSWDLIGVEQGDEPHS